MVRAPGVEPGQKVYKTLVLTVTPCATICDRGRRPEHRFRQGATLAHQAEKTQLSLELPQVIHRMTLLAKLIAADNAASVGSSYRLSLG